MNINFKYKGDKEEDVTIGWIIGNYFFTRRKSKKKHFFHKFQGYGISKEIVDSISKKGVLKVLIEYECVNEEKIYFLSDIKQWIDSKKEWKNKEDDLQVFVSERDMIEYKTIDEVPEPLV